MRSRDGRRILLTERLEPRAMLATVNFQNFEAVSIPDLPAGWVTTSANNSWRTQTSSLDTARNVALVASVAPNSDSSLVSPEFVAPPNAKIKFRNLIATQPSFDGGVFEISINGGAFTDIIFAGGSFDSGGYVNTLFPPTGNPLFGRSAWTGNSGGFFDTTVNLPAAAFGQFVQVRWRLGTDNTFQDGLWLIDTIRLTGSANFADFGDAPSPYPTTAGENGAAHLAAGPRLGATRDAEATGIPSATANSDGTDENGVTFGTIRVGALGATATVNVASAPMGARLDAWIDFNGDGNWGGPDEQIAVNVAVVNGNNKIKFDVPSFARDGQVIARFRLSSAGNLGPDRLAVDGEVEDYAVTILRPAVANGTFGTQNIISTDAISARSAIATDFDRDGDMDVLSASFTDNKIAVYKNSGNQNFAAQTISAAAGGAESVFSVDLDRDSDLDVLSALSVDDNVSWYENDGSTEFSASIVSRSDVDGVSVFSADMDGDGDMDVVSASFINNVIAWYENDGSEDFITHNITLMADGPTSVTAADVDGDGDMDVLSASFKDDTIAWYKNDGRQVFTPRTISTTAAGARSVFAADVDGDGDMDALSASYVDDKIAWYENNGNEVFTARTITKVANGAFSVFAADVDGDGDLDVLSASYLDDKIAWYENNGSEVFTPRTISKAADGARSVFAADVDGDGDLDVLSASSLDNKIAWYENGASTNIEPVIGLFDTAISYTENAVAVVLDSNATVTDSDSANLATGKLTVRLTSNGQSTDRLEIRNQGTGNGQIGVSGANVTFSGLVIGTYIGGTGTTPLVVTLNTQATPVRVQALLRNVTFRSLSQNPVITARIVRVSLTDGDGGTSIQRSKRINVVKVNDAPVITQFDTPVSYSAGSAGVILDSNAVVTDADSGNLAAGKLTVNLTSNAQSTDRLAIRNQGVAPGQIGVSGANVTFGGVVIGTFTGGTGPAALVVTFNTNATPARVQSLLRNIQYRNTSATPSALARTVQVTLTDGDGGISNLPTKLINVRL